MQTQAHKITLGTKEWADSNINCYYGCSNDCLYCYAKKMAIRFKRKTEDTWKIMIPNQNNIDKDYRKRKGRIMFPTSHDINIESLDNCLKVLNKLFLAKNNVLITTKPNYDCIRKLCITFKKYIDLIQFRFTITSINDDILNFWEPGAPKFEDRFESLKFAFFKGYKTSISIEPFLDLNPFILVDKILPYVTESIWIGKMNYYNLNKDVENSKYFYDVIRKNNQKKNLLSIIKESKINYNGIIRIKDSIYNFVSSKHVN